MDNIIKFEDFLDKMQGLLDKAKKQGHIIVRVEDLENAFPELKESEDERIRKALVRFHKSTIDIDGIKGEQIVAWLKKQGKEQPTIIWHSIDDKPEEMKELFCEWESEDATWHDVAFYDEKTNTFRHAKMPINVTKWVYVDELLEKQGEQKPADEPKFKVKYAGSEYNVFETKDIAGVTFYGIEDEPNHIDYVKAENCEIISVYAIKENGSPYPTKPAVFSEKKSKRMISAEAKEALYDKPTDEEMKEALHTEYEKGRADAIAEMQKGWSEEDETRLQVCIDCLQAKSLMGKVDTVMTNWLKSLKQRYTWKPSEEQMHMLRRMITALPLGEVHNGLESLYNDLKKLKGE